jgi:hypothetical protein
VLAIVAFLVSVTATLPSSAAPQVGPLQSIAYPGGLDEISNSCGPILRFSIRDNQYGVIPDSVYKNYPGGNLAVPVPQMTVPVYGYLDRTGLRPDQIHFYAQDHDPKFHNWQVLRAMYDYNTTVIWYTSKTAPSDQESLSAYAATHKNVLVLPWDDSIRELPNNRSYAFANWGIEQTCQTLSSDVLHHYVAFAAKHPVGHPVEAPKAKLLPTGALAGIAAKENPVGSNFIG